MNQNQRTRTARRRAPRDGGQLTTVDVSRQLDALEAAHKSGVLTVAEYDKKRAPLLNALAELDAEERQVLAAGGIGPLGVTIGTSVVVAGELIESAWGNQVRTDLLALNTGKIDVTGNWTMAGALTSGVRFATPTQPTASIAGAAIEDVGWLLSTIVGGGALPGTTPNLALRRTGSPAQDAGGTYVSFRRTSADTTIGSITVATGGASINYNTTSDPRAKVRDSDADDAASIVAELGRRVYRGRWRDDDGLPAGPEWVLLNSTDVERFAPFAVTGTADAVDDKGKPVHQQVAWPSLVPLLLAAVSQQADAITHLEAEVAELRRR